MKKFMSYETYAFLRGSLERALDSLHNEYIIARSFASTNKEREKMVAVWDKRRGEILDMKDELKLAVQANYRDHPNPEMRKFWGIKE